MINPQSKPSSTGDLRLFGEVIPELNSAWYQLGDEEQRLWRALADKLLPKVISLFKPSYVQLRYHSHYQAFLDVRDTESLEHFRCGPINLLEFPTK